MNKVLLFDFDGTIADSFENFLDISDRLASKHNFLPIPRDQVETLRAERSLIKHVKLPLYKLPFIAHDFKKMQQEHILQLEPIAGLPEVLHKLKEKGYVLGILTSNGRENVEKFLKNHNIDIFTYIFCDSSIFGKDKVLRKFLKESSVAKEDVTYIGDEIRDIEACQKVGVKVIAVTWGFASQAGLEKHHPDFLVDKPSELLSLPL